jgi:hypothetical protein
MRATIPFCLLALLLAGCDPMAFRSVDLQLPAPVSMAPASQSKVTFSASDANVQAALHIIDSVVTSNGLVCTPPRQSESGLLVLYNTPVGPQNPIITCQVFLVGSNFSVVFSEFGKMRSSAAVRQMCDVLRDKFGSYYGADRVTVRH